MSIVFLHIINRHTMDSENILIKFGRNVHLRRKELGISQEKLAEKAGLHRTYIGMIERAEKNITLINIERLANALNMSVSQLLNFRNE